MAVKNQTRAFKGNKLIIRHVNAGSLLSCLDEIKILVKSNKLDILCVSETWLYSDIPSKFLSIDGFSIYRSDLGRGGGVCIYARNELTIAQIDLGLPVCAGVEDVWLRVQSRKLPSVIVGAMYRHPHALVETFNYISETLQRASLLNKSIFLLGDLNDDLLQPQTKLSKILQETKFDQLIDRPTRITQTSKTLLDVIITNKKDLVLSFDVEPCHYSDHEMISVEINIDKPPKQREIKTFRSLKDYRKDVFCEKLMEKTPSLNLLLNTDDVNEQVDIFTNTFMKCLDSCAPIVTKTIHRPPAPWMNDEIKKEMQNRNVLRQRIEKSNNDVTNELYRISKKRVKSLLIKAKEHYHNKKFMDCRAKNGNMWDLIKQIVPNKKQSTKGVNTENPRETADNFNSFFATVGREVYLETSVAQRRSTNRNLHERSVSKDTFFRPQPVSVERVIKTITSLKNKNAYGEDGISGKFLIDSLSVTAYYLTIIINTSIVTGIFPDKWKFAIVNPLFKKGNPEDPSSFRPISLLSTLSKIIEKIIAEQLYDHMTINGLFSSTQHGFRKHLSTETALIKLTEKLYENIDNNEISLLCLCDLSKAFDSVSHSILLEKLNANYIDSFWFEDYLKNRKQSVRIDSCLSSKLDIEYGVPQGSVLGPLLFSIFINDLDTISGQSMLIQFADDAQFLFSSKVEDLDRLIERAEQTVEQALGYFSENGLKVNSDKTQFIFFGSRNNIAQIPENATIKVGTSSISPSRHVKNLGVTMDSLLTYDEHIDNLCKKANGLLYFINRQKLCLDDKSRICVVDALINSLFSYCSLIWSACKKSSISKVQKVQNFAAKVADGKGKKFERATPYIRKLGWLKINEKIQFDILTFDFKLTRGKIPNWVLNMPVVGEQQRRQTRQANDFVVPRTRTKLADNALKVRCSKSWNALPSNLKDIVRPSLFKREIRKVIS